MSSWVLTMGIRRYALTHRMVDIPNHRSSHSVITPRGGGLAFIVCFLISVLILIYFDQISLVLIWPFIVANGFVACIGFLDDRIHLSARWRFVGHILASIFALYTLGGMPSISLWGWWISASWIVNALALLFLCWLLNLYNFMDGINGIAGIEAISVSLGAVCLYCLSGEGRLIVLPLILACSVAGFLYWNFPVARIFMGDAGSGFLGFTFGLFAIQAAQIQPQFFWSWLIFLGVFIVDATFTLFRRLLKGEKIYEAHRSHAYQHAAQFFQSHIAVTLAVLVINIVWLWPFALLVGLGYLEPLLGILIAYLPLVGLCLLFKAGCR